MLQVKAYAKINLSLKILGKRPDGYHALESVMQSVSLHDLISLEKTSGGIELTTNNLQLTTDGKNLAYRAAEVFLKEHRAQNLPAGRQGVESRTQEGIRIKLEKKIPLAAGLAGGSADAAAVLFGMNTLYDSPFTLEELMDLGAQIGSDIPFCLIGGNCTVKGRGEVVTQNSLPRTLYYIICVPEIEVSTAWAYEAWDASQMSNDLPAGRHGKCQMTNNDLEPVVSNKYPIIQQIKEKLLSLGCKFAQMSGSGPSVFGEVEDPSQGEKIMVALKGNFPRSFLAQAVSCGVEIK